MTDTYKIDITEMLMYSVDVEADSVQEAFEKYANGMHSEVYNEETVDTQVEAVQNLDAAERSRQFMESFKND